MTKLLNRLQGGLTLQDYLCLINDRVFFWCDEKRLNSMRKAYLGRQCVLIIDMPPSSFALTCMRLELCRYNSGDNRADNPRTPPVFEEFSTFDTNNISKIAEMTVKGGVPDVFDFVVKTWNGTDSDTVA